MSRPSLALGLLLPLVLWTAAPPQDADAEPAARERAAESDTDAATRAAVERLLAAFNAHDVDALAAAVTDDIGWFYVDDAQVVVEAQGKDALRTSMTAYFATIPSARASFDDAMVSGAYMTVRERAFYERDGAERSQSSLAVYRVDDGRVARVWYYPTER